MPGLRRVRQGHRRIRQSVDSGMAIRLCWRPVEEQIEMSKAKRVALYLRVSTKGQTVENQRRELEAVAERSSWRVVAAYEDAGISGAKGRDKRPGFDRLLKDATRRQFDLIAAWSV